LRKYSRQARLAAIGEAGQEKLGAAEVVVPSGFAGTIAARYLRGAGVGSVREGGEGALTLDDARFAELDPAAREVALGAHAAARAILEIVRA
jgi:molybdopterin/thiamine biosynthesis adenylyltransferase